MASIFAARPGRLYIACGAAPQKRSRGSSLPAATTFVHILCSALFIPCSCSRRRRANGKRKEPTPAIVAAVGILLFYTRDADFFCGNKAFITQSPEYYNRWKLFPGLPKAPQRAGNNHAAALYLSVITTTNPIPRCRSTNPAVDS